MTRDGDGDGDGDGEGTVQAQGVSRVSMRLRPRGSAPGSVVGRGDGDGPFVGIPGAAWWIPSAAAVAGALVAVLADEQSGLIVGVSVIAGTALRRLSQQASFSFGDGFVPYKDDLGWPRGVQEDDDVHWAWSVGRTRSS